MLVRDPMPIDPSGDDREMWKKTVWTTKVSLWGDHSMACAAANVLPGQIMAWRRVDRRFAKACEHLDAEADRDVIEKVQQRARRGDVHAMGVAFRASRGVARPWEMRPIPEPGPPISAEVQDAMFCAGFRAMGIDPDDPNFGPLPGFPPDIPWANGKVPQWANHWNNGTRR
jgi:hypothetical protein